MFMPDELAYHEGAHRQWQADQEHFYGNLSLSEIVPTLPVIKQTEAQPPSPKKVVCQVFLIRAPEEEPNY